jgi:hypothetical protein
VAGGIILALYVVKCYVTYKAAQAIVAFGEGMDRAMATVRAETARQERETAARRAKEIERENRDVREWTCGQGRTVRGWLIEAGATEIRIRFERDDGRASIYRILVADLSDEDREYVRRWRNAGGNLKLMEF